MIDIDAALSCRNRTFRTMPGKLLLGPTGARLWADYLDPVPGFQGRIDFIHKLNIPLLFTVECKEYPEEMLPLNSLWQPSMLEMNWETGALKFREYKFITWQDQAVSVQRWENQGNQELHLSLRLPESFCPPSPAGWQRAVLPVSIHGIKPLCVFYCPRLFREGTYILKPGEQIEFILAMAVDCAMAVDNEETGSPDQLKAALENLIGAEGNRTECVKEQRKEYSRWFDGVPEFESSDPLIERTWWYRWFILRHTMAQPGFGNFHHTLFYEGRSHKMDKDVFNPSGWEFSKLIPLSTPLHLNDSRWHGDGEISREAIRSLCDSMDEDGLFRVLFTDERTKEYANYAGWALYLFSQVHQDSSFIKEVLNSFKKNVRGVYRLHKAGGDTLQIETHHPLTGKEYQPSYWYFTGYPDNPKDKSSYTPLKRVDRSIYVYLNALGIARLCETAGDPDSREFYTLAENVRNDILKKMWDEKSHFFYDLHFETNEKALVKNIVGIYPLWAGITGPEHLPALDYLFDPLAFNTGSAFASTARECPLFSAEGSWKKQYLKGRNGCMWNGPSWPYTTAIALETIAAQSKKHHHFLDSQFMRFFRAYCLQHFQGADLDRPYLTEHYNSITGEPISDEVDYNHSFCIDLIVRHIAGIEPHTDGFSFHPCRSALSYFSLSNLQLQGHRIDVSYQAAPKDGSPPGVRISVDHRHVYGNHELPDNEIRFNF